jgi:hypothetical protein
MTLRLWLQTPAMEPILYATFIWIKTMEAKNYGKLMLTYLNFLHVLLILRVDFEDGWLKNTAL